MSIITESHQEVIDDNDISTIIKRAKKNLFSHIQYAGLPDEIKDLLLNDLETESNPFYFCYASLFNNNKNHFIDALNIAGYFYYKYLIATDCLVDNSNNNSSLFKHLVGSNFYHEECIRILTTLFAPYPEFWQFWGKRKKEYLNAFQIDKQFVFDLSESSFKTLADNKSANGKVAIDSLFIIKALGNVEYNALLDSHKFFSAGFQYYDDVLDLKQDIQNKQTNVVLCELSKKMPKETFEKELNDPARMYKLMHVTGLATIFLEKSIESFTEAEKTVENIDCPFWKQVIAAKKKEVRGVLQNVNFYLESLKIKVRLSNEQVRLVDDEKKDLQNAISLGSGFIVKEQEADGSWKDSPVNTWLSGYWTTGFVLSALSNCKRSAAENELFSRSINYLSNKKRSLWGYIEGWIEDADSSNFALLGSLTGSNKIDGEITALLKYQQPDGGFTTYNDVPDLLRHLDDPKIKDVSGWTQNHICVSAGTLLLLSKTGGYEREKESLIEYLLNNISANGLWESYWWTSPYYSTCLIIEAANKVNNKALNDAVKFAISKLLDLQTENGLFADPFSKQHILYSSMILKAICSSPEYFQKNKIKMGFLAKAILEKQFRDGSWPSSYALRVPAADCLNPVTIKTWKKTDLGQNVIIEDIHRIITTCTAVAALNNYFQCINVG